MKWDGLRAHFGSDDLLPVWVADMDFESPDCVKEALSKLVGLNVYGYYQVPDGYYNAFIEWEKKYHDYEVKREWLSFMPGVVQALYRLVHCFTDENDSVAVMTPVYYPFFSAVENSGRNLVKVPLINDAGVYTIDFPLFEKSIAEKDVKMFILCSPHNPVGRVWTDEELKRMLDICKKYGVLVVSDEIHHDLIFSDKKQITAANAGDYDEILLMLTSASKTFNLAGCRNALLIVPDEALRRKYRAFSRRNGFSSGSAFGYVSGQAAFEGGRAWLDEVLEIIKGNYNYLCSALAETLPKAVISPLEGTYLMWIDVSAYMKERDGREGCFDRDTEWFMRDTCRLAVDLGKWFGGKEYDGFIRINLATKRENIEEVAARLRLLAE